MTSLEFAVTSYQHDFVLLIDAHELLRPKAPGAAGVAGWHFLCWWALMYVHTNSGVIVTETLA